ncbi:MAG: hypothetical protein ACYDH5_13905 [Acidimicrobiales bacterium]
MVHAFVLIKSGPAHIPELAESLAAMEGCQLLHKPSLSIIKHRLPSLAVTLLEQAEQQRAP